MRPTHDVILIGGGLIGGTLALALAGAGFRVALIDTLPADRRGAAGVDGRAYALAHASLRMLGALGLWDRLRDQAEPIRAVRAADGRVGAPPAPLVLDFPDGVLEEGAYGAMVEDAVLRLALRDALDAAPGVDHYAGAAAVAQEAGPAAVSVTLATGRRLAAPLLVGADGRASATAARAGITRLRVPYGQTALVTTLAHSRPHGGVAFQLFLPSGPFAILPLTGNRAAVVWSERARQAAALAALSDDAFLAALRPRVGETLGTLALAGTRWSYPLELSLAWSLVAPRVALAGEAAHALHPVAGQGLNLGLRDVATLAEVLAEARARGEDIGSAAVLSRYAAWRRFDIAALAAATDGFTRLFSNDNPLLRAVRTAGLGLVTALPPLRRALAREAAGLAGDLPRLLRGERLAA